MIRTKHVLWVVALGLVIPLAALANQTPQSTTPPAAHHKHSSKSHAAPKVNLNTASKEQIMTLPGMTDDAADKIIAGRPFKSKEELVQKNIMSKDELKKVEAKITTSMPKEASTKK